MGLQTKKNDELDSLFGELGVLEMPEGVELSTSESEVLPKSEDPFAKFLPKSEAMSEEN